MKSRKTSKASKKSQRADRSRKSLRGTMRSFEILEDRKLLAVAPWSDGMFYPPIGVSTALLPPSMSVAQYAAISAQQYGSQQGGNSRAMSGEGIQPFINTNEVEPNNVYSQASFVNLGTLDSQSDGVAVTGNLTAPTIPGQPYVRDTDWFAFDLRAGDVFDGRINGPLAATFDLSILDANRREVAGNTRSAVGVYPIDSPLNVGGTNPNADVAFVVPVTGRYYARVSDGDSVYTLTMRVRRPELESQPVGTKQKLFLDFDGEMVRRDIFDPATPGTARLAPLVDFLPSWGLTAADESRMIDKIIQQFQSKFFGVNAISGVGGNGWYTATGIAGQFDLEILNSRDHADPWGQPNVSRIVIGGTSTELGFSVLGIAQSIDVGNFATEETAIVVLDLMNATYGALPRAGNVPLEDVLAAGIGAVAAHEAGHFFGAWHTINSNTSYQLMDAGGVGGTLRNRVGIGPDGVFGTPDDEFVGFGTDVYDPLASLIEFGRQNSAATLAFGLSTGTVGGGTIRGSVYQDTNSNRVRDNGDVGLASVAIYVDINGNGVLDNSETHTLSDASGNYQLRVPAGTYTLRELVPAGQKLVSPANNALVVTVGNNQTLTGKDFINEKVSPVANGFKWNDLNGNGIRDTGEPGIEGVYIYIDLDGDQRIDIGEPTAKTDINGNYKLNFPGPGTYTVREVIAPGFTQTLPGALASFAYVVTLTGNPTTDAAALSALHFGNQIALDHGDAPLSYGAASAGFKTGLMLGTKWDAEPTQLYSADALGDDNDGVSDEDAINISNMRPLIIGSSNNPISLSTTNTSGQVAYLQAWIDFDGNGIFDSSERVISDLPVTGSALPVLNLDIRNTATAGNTFARLRLSTTQNMGPTGHAIEGEVEDYAVSLLPTADFAVNDTVTVRRNSVLNTINVLANDFKIGNEVLTVTGVGNAAHGSVDFTASGVLYTPTPGYIGPDSFTYRMQNSRGESYTATVFVTVALFFDNPMALDDSFDVPTNAIDFPLNVLANDIEGNSGALSIVSVTQPDRGGSLSIASGSKSLRYTPSRDFGGTEFFTYTVADASGKTSQAKGTLHTLPGDRANDKVEIRLIATDLAGNLISRIQQGQKFKIDMVVDDLRFSRDNTSPDLSAGVFAAYTDLLYNLQLVGVVPADGATPSGFNFAVSFSNNYINGQTGDAAIPGIIDELGAFYDGSSMNRPDPVRLASIIFEAKTPGIARFLADPADVTPASNSLLFDTSATAVPIEEIRYLGTSIEIVGDGVVFPVAIDDSVTDAVPVNAVQFPINVLANDLPGSSAPIGLKPGGLGVPLNGTVVISGTRVLYTPRLGFTGTDQFTYTLVDTAGNESIGRVTLKVGSNTADDDIVKLPLQVTNLNGTPITQVAVGQQFQLRGYVQDLRSVADAGVFAAYQDVIYSSTLASPVRSATNPLGFEITFGPKYQRVLEGDILTPGLFNELGAVATSNDDADYGNTNHLLFTITMTANALGTVTFVGDPADVSPRHDTLMFVPVSPVPIGQIRYGLTSVAIVGATTFGGAGGEYTNNASPLDVNADGFISPIDVLAVINALNTGGARSLFEGTGEGESSDRFFIDTNGDGMLSPMDALNVINHLNANSQGRQAEGEGTPSTSSLAANDAVYSDDLFDDGVDDLVAQLAPDIEQTWKKDRR